MKKDSFLRTICNVSVILLLFAASASLSSCRRQAQLVKIARGIEHATGYDSQENNSQQAQNARFSIQGVVQYDNGRVSYISGNSPILIQTPNGLVLGDYIHNSPVYDNDVATITEVYDLPNNNQYEYSFGETATRAYDVEGYDYMCQMSDRTFYFNVGRQLQ